MLIYTWVAGKGGFLQMSSLSVGWIKYWFRYIDDLLIIWTGSRDELLSFLVILNNDFNDFNLKFTHSISPTQIAFLDLTIMIDDKGELVTDLYRKPSSCNTILHVSSSHLTPLIRSIPYAQYLRLQTVQQMKISLIRQISYKADSWPEDTLKHFLRRLLTKPDWGLVSIFCTNPLLSVWLI